MFCMKSYVEGHRIHQLGSTTNLAKFELIQAKLAVLPIWYILCLSIKYFMQNIF